jgi:hypothetical protein
MDTLSHPGVVYETFSVPAERDAAFNAWYEAERLPRLLNEPGVLAAVRWRFNTGDPCGQYLTYFDLADADDLRRRGGWRADAVGNTARGREQVAGLTELNCGLYEQVFPSEEVTPRWSEAARALLLITLESTPAIDEEFNEWYNEEHLPPLLRAAGYLRIRRFRALEGAPTYVTLYDTTSWDDYETMPERNLVRGTPWGRRIFRTVTRTVSHYDRVLTKDD